MKKQLSFLLLVMFIASCTSNSNQAISSSSSQVDSSNSVSISTSSSSSSKVYPLAEGLAFELPKTEEIKVHSKLVEDYFKQEQYDYSKMDATINAKTDLGDNLPINIQFYWYGFPPANSYKIKIYDKSDNKVVFEETTEETELEPSDYKSPSKRGEINFINYKIGPAAEYILEVIPALPDYPNYQTPYRASFTIPNGYFRTITVDGVNNFRDLGDGVHLKQGLIYRSATFENNTSANEDNPLSISELGKKQIAPLGLVSEIDLRKDDEKKVTDKSVIGLNYLKAPLYYGGQNILTYKNSEYNNPETIKTVFEFLGNKDNYPLNFHCVRGTDRTGCLAYLIKGLLGIEEEMLYRDFLFSNFYNIGSPVKLESVYYATNPNATTKYANVIKQTEGETLKDKIYNYLSSDKVGVSTETLDNIINILKA